MEIGFEGLPVKKVYYKGQVPKISNGYFKISNKSEQLMAISVLDVHVSDGEKKIPINDFFLYKLPEYIALDPKKINLERKEVLQLDLSFPFISDAGLQKNKIKVYLTLKVNDDTIQSSSLVELDFRVPKE